jgi:alpha-beta hydrolase superfamily lysophospholipase
MTWLVILMIALAGLMVFARCASAADHRGMAPSPIRGAPMTLAQIDTARETAGPLRKIIAELQRGAPDAASMEPALQTAVQAQSQAMAALLGRLGPLQQIEFVGTQDGADAYKVSFQNGAATWFIRMSPAGKIAGLFFQPIQAAEAAGEDVAAAGLSGTLLKPPGIERPPVVLLISGSGPTDRNGNQGGTGPAELRQLAEQLAERGIASLRYDKRGIGRSVLPGLREENLVLDSFVEDAAAWLGWLQQRSDLGPRFVAGHSEGGLIAILLAKRTSVSGIVLLATPGRRLGDVTRDQLSRSGMAPALRTEALAILAALERGEAVANVSAPLLPLLRPSVQPFMRSMLVLDPAQDLRALRLPVLIVSGGHDLQVGPDDAARLAAARPDAARLDIPGMNHVLKIAPADPAGQQDAYANPDLPLAPGVGDAIATFVRRSAL